MKKLRVAIVLCVALGVVLLMHPTQSVSHVCDRLEIQKSLRLTNVEGLPWQYNDLFAGSGRCGSCHAWDPNGVASVDTNGNDINLTDQWRSTLMANSAKDPFWRAKVSHETLVNPAHQADLEDKCTSCHAPLGHFNAKFNGQQYSMADLELDTLGLDGVSCGACHQLDTLYMGDFFSGELVYDTNHVVYGPYHNPYSSPMELLIGFSLEQTDKIRSSEACAGCHTLVTQTVDLGGNYTGNNFVEQATYHEWLNSDYSIPGQEVSCQQCHMPSVPEAVILSIDYEFVGGRSPFAKHYFVGGNAFMLRLMKDNFDSLGIFPQPDLFDSTILRTEQLLQTTLEMDLQEANRTNDTVFYALEITNKSGHKFPSGYPSRRAYVQFVVMDDAGDTLFASGLMDPTYELVGHDPNYEPHYQTIRSEQEVQIYEMVMADVNGDKTTVLERGDSYLKDNRLTPIGFSMSHSTYDTTQIAGLALNDPDFNWDGSTEGTGGDIVYYNIPLNGYTGNLNTIAQVYYQSAPPAWMDEMFAYNSTEIDRFRDMYNNADCTPSLVGEAKNGDLWTSIFEQNFHQVEVFPNPTNTGNVTVEGELSGLQEIVVFDMAGRVMPSNKQLMGTSSAQVSFEGPSGTYVMILVFEDGRRTTQKVVRQ